MTDPLDLTSRWARVFRPGFLRNVLTVATGSAIAQAIGMAFAPVITRLYGPEAFGLQALFVSLVGLLATIAPLGYPTAIVLPRNDSDALGMAKISLLSAALFCTGATLLLLLAGKQLLSLLGAESLSDWVLLLPVATFAMVLWSVQMNWLNRKQAFATTARLNVVLAFVGNVGKSTVGMVNPSALALIVTNVLATIMGALLAFWGCRKSAPPSVSPGEQTGDLRGLAWAHRDFPFLRTPQNLINLLSQSLPLLMLSTYFGAAAAGHYSIALTVLGVPAALIGNSVMSVFYPRVNRAIHHNEDARALIVKATTAMAWTGATPFLIVIIWGPSLFRIVFGEGWEDAGRYAQWLSAWIFLQYINKPAVASVPALGLQGGLLLYELASTASKVLALCIGFWIFRDPLVAVALFAMVGVIAYAWLILWVVRRSGGVPGEHAARCPP